MKATLSNLERARHLLKHEKIQNQLSILFILISECAAAAGFMPPPPGGGQDADDDGIGYETDYTVRIDVMMVWIMGIRIKLTRREEILLTILAQFAHEVAGTSEGQYLNKNCLLNLIEKYYPEDWPAPTFGEVDHAVCKFRKRMIAHNLLDELIETPRGRLRLSTPASKIKL